jgi:hypothetical protein
MRFKFHFLSGFIFTILLYFLFYPVIPFFGLLIIFLSSFLMDADHFFYYIFKKRDFNLIRAYKWYIENTKKFCSSSKEKQKKIYIGFYIFHGIEILIILFLLGFYISPIFNFILIGFLFHLSVDLISEIIFEQRIDKISLIQNYLAIRKLTHIDVYKDN